MEEVNYLKDLKYKKSNYEGVKVFYGDDVRAITIQPKFSVNLTPGSIILFTKKRTQKYIKHSSIMKHCNFIENYPLQKTRHALKRA